MNDWRHLILPVVGIAAATALVLTNHLPAEAVLAFIVGVVLPSPTQPYPPKPSTP